MYLKKLPDLVAFGFRALGLDRQTLTTGRDVDPVTAGLAVFFPAKPDQQRFEFIKAESAGVVPSFLQQLFRSGHSVTVFSYTDHRNRDFLTEAAR